MFHIRRGNRDNVKKISMFLNKTIFCDPSLELSHLYKTVLMKGHNICFRFYPFLELSHLDETILMKGHNICSY